MSTTLKKTLIMMVLLSSISVCQDTEILFRRYQLLKSNILNNNSIVALGDQNGDGCDDILIYDCNNVTLNIYLGGNPMDTIPDLTIRPQNAFNLRGIIAEDLNYDGYKDIMFSRWDITEERLYTELYYGGPLLDTIPDFTMPRPGGASIAFGDRLYTIDFDGDSKKELVISDYYPPYAPSILDYYGAFYFYHTYPKMDSIPFNVVTGDTSLKIKLYNDKANTIGDINGDGKDDFSIVGYIDTSTTGDWKYINRFYFGNAEYNLSNPQVFEPQNYRFQTRYMPIVKDVNGDGCDDIVTTKYGDYFPYYYGNYILYGSYPIDTIPDIGINTQNNSFYQVTTLVSTDFNNDGYNDILVNFHMFVNMEARLWYGAKNMNPAGSDHVAQRRWGRLPYPNDHFGALIAQVGDVNGDGFEDFCIGLGPEGTDCENGYVVIFKGDTLYRDPTGVDDIEEGDKGNNSLVIYPNPFNPETVISYELLVKSKVTLVIYDILGKEISKLVDEEKESGRHQINFDARKHNLSSGVYLVSVHIKDKTGKETNYSQKISLIK